MRNPYDMKIVGAIRLLLATLLIALQVGLLAVIDSILVDYNAAVYALFSAVGVIFAAYLMNQKRDPNYTNIWILVIVAFPFLGLALYLFWGQERKFHNDNKKLRKARLRLNTLKTFGSVIPDSNMVKGSRLASLRYLNNLGFPSFTNTDIVYFPSGEAQFTQMELDIKAAKHHVWLCYFILAEGKLWDKYEALLLKKAEEGLDVRLMFDDFGSIVKAPATMMERLEAGGVKTVKFNPVLRYISRMYLNYRNHQKIVIVDGHIGYTGGTNLADEYVNIHQRFGHWKDTAIKLTGDAVNSLSEQFLALWELEAGEDTTEPTTFANSLSTSATGYVTPFMDGPFGITGHPAKNMYRKLVTTASNYLWIMTPYFAIDYSFISQIVVAATSGVDVRLITPGVSDKWYVHVVTRSNYMRLLEAGVRVYEYTPGFIHAKTVLADDDQAVTGTINFDFRSFDLHFENGVYLVNTPVISEIKQDFQETFAVAKEISKEEWQKRSRFAKTVDGFFRIFSPFL